MNEAMKSGRRGVTRDDIWGAADALLLSGARPTVEKVRGHLGGGSPNTVGPHLDTWFQGLGQRLSQPGALAPAHAGHPESVTRAAEMLWAAAQQEARRALEADFAGRFAALELEKADVVIAREALDAEKRLQFRAQLARLFERVNSL